MVTCPECHQDVEPVARRPGKPGYFGEARFCPTRNGFNLCETDLHNHAGLPLPERPAAAPELESTLQKRVCRYLDSLSPEVAWWRQSVGHGLYPNGTPAHWGTPGMSDLLVCARGAFLGLELKSATGHQEKSQRKYERVVEEAGGRYYLVRSLREAVTAVEETLAARPHDLTRYQNEIERLKAELARRMGVAP